jgi:L-threonylcarbamoyladenylate synthase
MKIVKINHSQAISQAIKYLKSSKLVIYPTDTAYGIAADVASPKAIKNLLRFKGHRQNKPISIAVADQPMAKQYVDLNSTACNLYDHFLPGPLTVISKLRAEALSKRNTLAIRIPNYPWTLKLIKQFGRPITATSANPSGQKTPYSVKEIFPYIQNTIYDILVLDAGQLPKILPSTIIDTTLKSPKIIRYGSLLSRSSQATQFLGQILAQQNLDVILLFGKLGTGKTTLAKGLAQGLGIKDLVRSPTYNLIKEYSGLTHVDLYRLKSLDKILSYIQNLSAPSGNLSARGGKILVVEWPELLKNPLKLFPHQKILSIKFKTISVNHRHLELKLLS